jgi:hypothetical protein
MAPTKDAEIFSDAETTHRREEALKRMLSTPHKPHADQKPSPPKKPRSKAKKTTDSK